MPKATPRDIIEGLQTLLKNAKANKRNWTQNSDNVHWVTLAKKLISTQAAEIEDLKQKLGEYTGNVDKPDVPINTDLDTQGTDAPPAEEPSAK